MTDDPMRTIALTDEGELAFQEYFVHRGCEPRITGLRFDGADAAKPSPAFAEALVRADAIVFCPSNPLVSIGPVLAVPGVYDAIESFTGPRIAVSPIVGGQALKGPAAKMMAEFGQEVSSAGVAQGYQGIVDMLVIDNADRDEASRVEACGIRALVTTTIMQSVEDKVRLAREVLDSIDRWDG
jgi:LPPG:FO 2-phospho-L-lactate transferase